MKIFRVQGIAGIAIVILLIGGFATLFLDGILKNTLESQGSKVLDTQIELGSLSTSLTQPGISIAALAIANPDNPMENSLEIASIKVALDGARALRKKIVVDEMVVEKIELGKKRKTPAKKIKPSGESSGEKEEKPEQSENDEVKKNSGIFALPSNINLKSPEDILKSEKLETMELVGSTKKEIASLKEKWEAKIKTDLSADALDEIKQKIDNLKKNLKGRSGLSAITGAASAIQEAQEIKKDIENRIQNIRNLQSELEKDTKKVQTLLADLKNAPQKDFDRLKKKYALDVEGGSNILGSILGDQIKSKLDKAWRYYEKLSPYLSGSVEKKKEPVYERGKGLFIKFAEKTPYPDFLIKRAKLSLNLFDASIAGELKDFSDNQKVYGKPAFLSFNSGKNDKFDQFDLRIKLDRTQAVATDTLDLTIQSLKLASLETGNAVNIKNGLAQIKSQFQIQNEHGLKGHIQVKLSSLNLASPQMQGNDIGQAVMEALSSANSISIKAQIEGTPGNYNINIESNLDKIVSKAARKVIGNKLKNFDRNLLSGIVSATSSSIGEALDSQGDFLDFKNILGKQNASLDGMLGDVTGGILSEKSGILPLGKGLFK